MPVGLPTTTFDKDNVKSTVNNNLLMRFFGELVDVIDDNIDDVKVIEEKKDAGVGVDADVDIPKGLGNFDYFGKRQRLSN